MRAYAIIATKGRPKEVGQLLSYLNEQTRPVDGVIIVGASEADLPDLSGMSEADLVNVRVYVSPAVGLTSQRNYGIEKMAELCPEEEASFAVFFDDDFCPDREWIQQCEDYFVAHNDVVGITGHVLADGVRGPGLTYQEADAFLSGQRPPEKHWASGAEVRDVNSLYGCNMALKSIVLLNRRFDEVLPLYGWQEDRDYTGQAMAFGRTVYIPQCRGVHLGAKGGRTSGVRLGYSQIANPVYLLNKGTMTKADAMRTLLRSLIGNSVYSFIGNKKLFDYPGRFRGNMTALIDLMRGRCSPTRILDF